MGQYQIYKYNSRRLENFSVQVIRWISLALILLLPCVRQVETAIQPENGSRINFPETPGMKKENDMQSLNELIRALSEPEVSVRDAFARSTHTCKLCGESALGFRDRLAEFEYNVSAICQKCQDRYFH